MGNILGMAAQGKSLFDIGPQSDLDPEVQAFRVLLLLGQRLRSLMDDRLRADGLTTQQAALLTAVTALGSPSLTEVAQALGTTHQNAAQLVTALERKDFLRVEPDPADKRRRRLVPTETSTRYWQARDDGDFAAVREWFAALDAEELRTLLSLTERVLASL